MSVCESWNERCPRGTSRRRRRAGQRESVDLAMMPESRPRSRVTTCSRARDVDRGVRDAGEKMRRSGLHLRRRLGRARPAGLDSVHVALEQEADSALGLATGQWRLVGRHLANRDRRSAADMARLEGDAEDRPGPSVGIERRAGRCERGLGGLGRVGSLNRVTDEGDDRVAGLERRRRVPPVRLAADPAKSARICGAPTHSRGISSVLNDCTVWRTPGRVRKPTTTVGTPSRNDCR